LSSNLKVAKAPVLPCANAATLRLLKIMVELIGDDFPTSETGSQPCSIVKIGAIASESPAADTASVRMRENEILTEGYPVYPL